MDNRGHDFEVMNEEVDAAEEEGETDVLSDVLKKNNKGSGFANADDDDYDEGDDDDDDDDENDCQSDDGGIVEEEESESSEDGNDEEGESESVYVLAEFPDLDGHDVFSLDSTKTVRLRNLFGTGEFSPN